MTDLDTRQIHRHLQFLYQEGGTDLLLTAGAPPLVRLDGELRPLDEPALDEEATGRVVQAVLGPDLWAEFIAEKEVDFSFGWEGVARFRGNAFHQRGAAALALRLIPIAIPTFDDLGLPDILSSWVGTRRCRPGIPSSRPDGGCCSGWWRG